MLGLGSCLGRCPALQPWLASALLPALPAMLSQGTSLSLWLCSIPEVGVLPGWKGPHLLCSPLGLINVVISRLAD